MTQTGTANIALVLYADGERRYIIAPAKVSAGDTLVSGQDAPIKVGNCLPLRNIPLGSTVHCVEMKPGKGAQIARSAGGSAQLVAKEGKPCNSASEVRRDAQSVGGLPRNAR